MPGKGIRLRRLFPTPESRLFSVPLDHAVSIGPIEGLERLGPLASELADAGADLLIVTKGSVREIAPSLRPTTRLGVHMSVSTTLGPRAHHKVLVGSAEEALALGADVLSVQVNFGVAEEGAMLADLGTAVDQCRVLGLPLLCMTYIQRPTAASPEEQQHACRAVADLGADIVKTNYPGSPDLFGRLCRTTPVPVLIGGGVRHGSDEEFLQILRDSITAGGRGICIGRNLFQRVPVGPFARRVAELVHGAP
ncbi:MAG: fructose-bisphosphate aldolase [Thermoplasmata archaeon]|nr:fructose-bisphosphate aldolase [Thermoplasmata archaeon]